MTKVSQVRNKLLKDRGAPINPNKHLNLKHGFSSVSKNFNPQSAILNQLKNTVDILSTEISGRALSLAWLGAYQHLADLGYDNSDVGDITWANF